VKVVLQRVTEARVRVANKVVGEISAGLVILFCAEWDDTISDAEYFAGKIAKMRIFPDENGKTNLSIMDVGGSTLVISHFTLAADWRKGNRPGFSKAATPELGNELYEQFCKLLSGHEVPVEKGVFGAEMSVELVNDGPFTIMMDSDD
jgi:D-tyrosyl-tRNA(Tyr) deacylase